jgi:hypothetical protein
MNTKRLPEITMVACLVILAAWWWWPVKPVPVKPMVVREHLSRPNAETIPPEEAPIRAIIPAPPVVAEEVPTPAAFDPQADLSTAIPDIIRLVQAGGMTTLLQNYLPPEEFAGVPDDQKAKIIEEMQSPENQQQMQQALWALQAVQFMPPVYNADKTRVTYTPPDGSPKINFVNEKGRWYLR